MNEIGIGSRLVVLNKDIEVKLINVSYIEIEREHC